MTSPLSCVLFILLLLFQLLVHNYLKKFRMFLNTRKKFRVFWGEYSNISLALCSEFLLRVKKTNWRSWKNGRFKVLAKQLNSRFSQLTNSWKLLQIITKLTTNLLQHYKLQTYYKFTTNFLHTYYKLTTKIGHTIFYHALKSKLWGLQKF